MSAPANALHFLAWDSDYLGFGVARLEADVLAPGELNRLVAEARAAGLRLLYLIAAPADATSNATARAVGAWLADRKVTFAMPVAPAEKTAAAFGPVIQATTTWTAQLESLALQSGEYSRFRRDTNFDPTVFTGLYQRWLRNSLSHEIAREVLVFDAERTGHALGLLTLGLKNGRADIGLLAVDAQARGHRIGQQLVAAARQRTAAWGLGELQVVTQLDNEPACAFYRHCGFRERQVEHIYHFWL